MSWNFFDIDKDGIKTSTEVVFVIRNFLYIGLAAFAVTTEGNTEYSVFTDWEMGLILGSSFGLAGFEMFIKAKTIQKNEENQSNDPPDYDFIDHTDRERM